MIILIIGEGNEEKHVLEIPFPVGSFKSHKTRWCRMNKNAFCESSFLSWTRIKSYNKAVIDWGLLAFSSLWVPFVYAYRSYSSRDKTQFFVPAFASLKSGNLMIAAKVCAFIITDFRLLSQRRKGHSFCLGSLFLSPSVPPLQRKKDFIHSFTSRYLVAKYIKATNVGC